MKQSNFATAIAPFLLTAASLFPTSLHAEQPQDKAAIKLREMQEGLKEVTREQLIRLLDDRDWYTREPATRELRDRGVREIQTSKNMLPWKHELTVEDASLEQRVRLRNILQDLSEEEGKLRWDGIRLKQSDRYEPDTPAPFIEYMTELNKQLHGQLDMSPSLLGYRMKHTRKATVRPAKEGDNFWEFVRQNLENVKTMTDKDGLTIDATPDRLTTALAYDGALCGKFRIDHRGMAVFFETDVGVELATWRFVDGHMTLRNDNDPQQTVVVPLESRERSGGTDSSYIPFENQIDPRALKEVDLRYLVTGAPMSLLHIDDLSERKNHETGDYIVNTGALTHETVTATHNPGTRYFLDCLVQAREGKRLKKLDANTVSYCTGYATDEDGNVEMLFPDDNSKNDEAGFGRRLLLSFPKKPTGLYVRLPQYSIYNKGGTLKRLKYTFE